MSERSYILRKADRDGEKAAGVAAVGVGAGAGSFARAMASEDRDIARGLENRQKARFDRINFYQRQAANAPPDFKGVKTKMANQMRIEQAHATNRRLKHLKNAKRLNRAGLAAGLSGVAAGVGLVAHASRKDSKS
jgi:hypothetical protein